VKERPHFKRSALWRHQREITAWLQEGYSFRQIADELTRQGIKVSTRWLQEWYAKNVGRRRARPASNTNVEPPAASASLPSGAPESRPLDKNISHKNPSPDPQASTTPAPPDTDFTALFQSQFKRPRK